VIAVAIILLQLRGSSSQSRPSAATSPRTVLCTIAVTKDSLARDFAGTRLVRIERKENGLIYERRQDQRLERKREKRRDRETRIAANRNASAIT